MIATSAGIPDDVLAVWSIKSYSRVMGRTVLAAFFDQGYGGAPAGRTLTTRLRAKSCRATSDATVPQFTPAG